MWSWCVAELISYISEACWSVFLLWTGNFRIVTVTFLSAVPSCSSGVGPFEQSVQRRLLFPKSQRTVHIVYLSWWFFVCSRLHVGSDSVPVCMWSAVVTGEYWSNQGQRDGCFCSLYEFCTVHSGLKFLNKLIIQKRVVWCLKTKWCMGQMHMSFLCSTCKYIIY